jgi:hypothetical protein
MTCISDTERAEAEARIAKNKVLLAEAQTALENTIKAEVESYRLDTGEGSQMAKRRKFSDMTDLIDRLNSWIRADEELLAGIGVVNINVRRKIRQGYIIV